MSQEVVIGESLQGLGKKLPFGAGCVTFLAYGDVHELEPLVGMNPRLNDVHHFGCPTENHNFSNLQPQDGFRHLERTLRIPSIGNLATTTCFRVLRTPVLRALFAHRRAAVVGFWVNLSPGFGAGMNMCYRRMQGRTGDFGHGRNSTAGGYWQVFELFCFVFFLFSRMFFLFSQEGTKFPIEGPSDPVVTVQGHGPRSGPDLFLLQSLAE